MIPLGEQPSGTEATQGPVLPESELKQRLLNAVPASATASLAARVLSQRLLGLTISKPDGDNRHGALQHADCHL